MSGRNFSNLALSDVNLEFVSAVHYDTARSSDDLYNIDYSMARVFHSPSYSDLLAKEATHYVCPKVVAVPSINGLEVSSNYNEDENKTTHALVSSSTKRSNNQEEELVLSSIIEQAVLTLNELDNKENLYICLAYFLVQANMECEEKKLLTHYIHFKSVNGLMFKHLSEYIGSRWEAERDREVVREVFTQILSGGQ